MIELSWYFVLFVFVIGVWAGSGLASGTMIYKKFRNDKAFDRRMMILLAVPLGPILFIYQWYND
jgi:hypothetical protein